MKIDSKYYITVDRYLDFVPFVSTGKGIIELFLKAIATKTVGTKLNPYFINLKDKPVWRSVTILFPFVGNFVILLYDLANLIISKKIESKKRPLKNSSIRKQYIFDRLIHVPKIVIENQKEVLKDIPKAEEKVDADAEFKTGNNYENGLGVERDEWKALEHYKNAAAQNHTEAMYSLGCLLHNTQQSFKNLEEGFQWLMKAADAGSKEACKRVAQCYTEGTGTNINRSKVFEYYKKGADLGDPNLQDMVGYKFNVGEDVEQDDWKALEYYRKAVAQDIIQSMNSLGLLLQTTQESFKNVVEGYEWLKKAADKGHSFAQYNVAYSYEFGEGVTKDEKMAFEYYQRSANAGCELAQDTLGLCHEKGRWVEQDKYKAKIYYERAAKQLFVPAMYHLGKLLIQAGPPIENKEEGFQWVLRAANNGNDLAQSLAGHYYEEGKIVPKDLSKAFEYFKMCADNGKVNEQALVAENYRGGIGVAKDPVKSFEYYKKAADGGHINSQSEVGYLFSIGLGVDKDIYQAQEYYLKAINNNHPNAMHNLGVLLIEHFNNPLAGFQWLVKGSEAGIVNSNFCLGVCYEEGKGTEINREKAFKYYKKAADGGHTKAKLIVAKAYREGLYGVAKDENKAREYEPEAVLPF